MDTVQTSVAAGRVKGPEGYLHIEQSNDHSGEAIPVLFLHSFAGSNDHWKEQYEHLKNTRPVAAFDFRAHGNSDTAGNGKYDVPALVKDVEAVVKELGWNKFVLVGHSMGGSTAIAYADEHPNQVAGLFLAGTPGKTDPEQSKQVIASLESDKYQQVMDAYMKTLVADAKPGVATQVTAGLQELSRPVTLEIIKGQFAYNPVPALQKYTGPKMIVYTSHEGQTPTALYKQAPDVPSKMIGGTSHWIQMDKPAEFNQLLDEFLNKADQQTDRQIKK